MFQLGPYQVWEEIGRGGMGVVYRGYDPLIGREVALKTIRLFEITDPAERSAMQDRLRREAQSAGRLSHPNIVTIYQVGYAELQPGQTSAYLAMEFVPGPSLASVAETYRNGPPEAIFHILRQAAAALDYAHSRGVIHRDIKPANLLLAPDGTLKITDFGVAKIVSQTMTATGAVLGSPAYMSPEQVKSSAVDGRTDQYSLAVVAYELFSGRKPFEADTLSALVFKIAMEPPPPPDLPRPEFSGRIGPVLLRALAKDPSQRYNSCMEFVSALEGAFRAGVPTASLPARRPARRWVPAAAIAAGIALAGWLVIAARNSAPKPKEPVTAPVETAVIPKPAPQLPVRPQAISDMAVKQKAATAPKAAPAKEPPPLPPPAAPAVDPQPQPSPAATAPVQPPREPDPPAPPREPVRVPPRPIKTSPASYTPETLQKGIEGTVLLSVDIDEQGIPRRARVLRSLEPGLDRKAIESLAGWRFSPATEDGKPVPSTANVEVTFQLLGAPRRSTPSLKSSTKP